MEGGGGGGSVERILPGEATPDPSALSSVATVCSLLETFQVWSRDENKEFSKSGGVEIGTFCYDFIVGEYKGQITVPRTSS